MKAVIYARFSSDQQREESITAQIRAAKQYCDIKGYEVVKEYADEAVSGRSDDRPAFQTMIKDAKTGLFNVVVFHKVDRNSRNSYDYYFNKRTLQKAGVRMEYADQHIDSSPEGGMMEAMLVGMAEYYSKNLARETLKGLKENAYQSKFNGGVPPLGYDVDKDNKYIINEQEADAVRLIFRLYIEGKGYGCIIDELRLQGYRTKRGGYFGKNSLHDILKNERYVGNYVFGKVRRQVDGSRNSHLIADDRIVIPDAIPPIVTKKQWNEVQAKMVKNKKSPASYKGKVFYMLSGLLECSCGSSMVGQTRRVNGKEYGYYQCGKQNRRSSEGCTQALVKKDSIENAVMDQAANELFNKKNIPHLLKEIKAGAKGMNKEIDTELKRLSKQEADLAKKLNNILDMIEGGHKSAALKTRLSETESALSVVTVKQKKLMDKAKGSTMSDEQMLSVLNSYADVAQEKDPVKTRDLLEQFSAKVVITGDTIELHLKLFCFCVVPRTRHLAKAKRN